MTRLTRADEDKRERERAERKREIRGKGRDIDASRNREVATGRGRERLTRCFMYDKMSLHWLHAEMKQERGSIGSSRRESVEGNVLEDRRVIANEAEGMGIREGVVRLHRRLGAAPKAICISHHEF